MFDRMREMAVLVFFTGGKEVSFFHSAIKFISFIKMMRNLRQYVEPSFLIQTSPKNWKEIHQTKLKISISSVQVPQK